MRRLKRKLQRGRKECQVTKKAVLDIHKRNVNDDNGKDQQERIQPQSNRVDDWLHIYVCTDGCIFIF